MSVSIPANQRFINLLENSFHQIGRKHFSFTTLLFACYAIRLPFLHLETLIHGEKDASRYRKAGNWIFFSSDAAAGIDWFSKIKIIHVEKVPFPIIVSLLRGTAYLLYGIHAIKVLSGNEKSKAPRTQAKIDLILAISQVALTVIACVGLSTAPYYYLLTGAALTLNTISVAHKWIKT